MLIAGLRQAAGQCRRPVADIISVESSRSFPSMIRFLQSGNKAVKYILGALLTVICLSMVVYLIPGLSSDIDFRQRGTEVASVGGEKISAEEVNRRVDQMQRRQQQPLPEF